MIGAPSLALAFAAGVVSFISPCCLPLVPGYLAAISGGEPVLQERGVDRRLMGRSLLFVASFSSMFIVLGLTATALGSFLLANQAALERVAGVAIIVMGTLFVGSVFVVRLNRDWRPQRLIERAGNGGRWWSAWRLQWRGRRASDRRSGRSSASLRPRTQPRRARRSWRFTPRGWRCRSWPQPLAFNAAQRAFGFFRRHYPAIQVGSGLVLIAMGILVLSGGLFRLNLAVRQLLDGVGLDFFNGL